MHHVAALSSLLFYLVLISNAVLTAVVAFSPASRCNNGARLQQSSPAIISLSSPTTTSRSNINSNPPRSSFGGGRRRRCGITPSPITGKTIDDTTTTRLHQSVSSSSYAIDIDTNPPFLARRERVLFELSTLLRVLLPSLLAGTMATFALPMLSHRIANFITSTMDSSAQVGMLSDVVGSFIGLISLLYSILVGQVFGFLYSQQEVSIV